MEGDYTSKVNASGCPKLGENAHGIRAGQVAGRHRQERAVLNPHHHYLDSIVARNTTFFAKERKRKEQGNGNEV